MNAYNYTHTVTIMCTGYLLHTHTHTRTSDLYYLRTQYNEVITVCIYSLDDILLKMRGLDLTIDYLEEHGFDRPILVESKDDLGLRVPPPSFKISDIERCVGMSVVLYMYVCIYVCVQYPYTCTVCYIP